MALQTAHQLKEIDALVAQIGNMEALRDGAEEKVFALGERIHRLVAGTALDTPMDLAKIDRLTTKQLAEAAEVERYNDLLLHLAQKLAAALQADIRDFMVGDAF